MKKHLLLVLSLFILSSTCSFAQTPQTTPETPETEESPAVNSDEQQTQWDKENWEKKDAETASPEEPALQEAEELSEEPVEVQASEQQVKYTYAYVLVDGKIGRRLKVYIDTGDEAFPVPNKKDVIKELRKKGSYVAVVNFMIEHGYEVVSINQAYEMAAGNAGIEGLSCVLKKPVEAESGQKEEDAGLTINNAGSQVPQQE